MKLWIYICLLDVNECVLVVIYGCDKEYGMCSNIFGGYMCLCNKGFIGIGYVCVGKMRYSIFDFS